MKKFLAGLMIATMLFTSSFYAWAESIPEDVQVEKEAEETNEEAQESEKTDEEAQETEEAGEEAEEPEVSEPEIQEESPEEVPEEAAEEQEPIEVPASEIDELTEVLIEEPSVSFEETQDVNALLVENLEEKEEVLVLLMEKLPELEEEEVLEIIEPLFAKAPLNMEKSRNLAPEGVERQGDGSNIENISVKWITPDTIDNADDSLLYIKPNDDNKQTIKLQLNYALSGEHDYEPGDVTITIPAYIFESRTGSPHGKLLIPYAEEPSTKNDFNWKKIGDTYVLTNTRKMSAATKGYIQLAFAELTPHVVQDMKESNPFSAYIEVTTHLGNTIGLESNEITAQIDTEAQVTSARKHCSGKASRVDKSQIPEEYRIDGEEEYILVSWYFYARTQGNTVYDIIVQDELEDEYNGFIIETGETTWESSILDTYNPYPNYAKDTKYWYIKSAYPASQFEPDTEYLFKNNVTFTLTEEDPEMGDDPQLVTVQTASAQTIYQYHLPVWMDPTGHFMVHKNGNDNKVYYGDSYETHRYSSSYRDLFLQNDGYYGIYYKGLNDLVDNKNVEIAYTVETIGYLMPWTFESDGTEMAARKLSNYGKHDITMVTEEKGMRGIGLGDLVVNRDFSFTAIEFPVLPRIYKATPQNINEDGSFTAMHAGDGTFAYTEDTNISNIPDVLLEIYKDGEWSEYATCVYTSGSPVITLASGESVSGIRVPLPENVESFRTKTTTNIAGIIYDVRPVVTLYPTVKIKAVAERLFSMMSVPEINIYNKTEMTAFVDDNEEAIVDIEKEGYDRVRGYTSDIKAKITKSAVQNLDEVDFENRLVLIHYKAKVEEESVISDLNVYKIAQENGDIPKETNFIWYDLLPKGVSPKLNTVNLGTFDSYGNITGYNGNVVNAYTIENYKGSGRTLLVVEGEREPKPERFREGDSYYYKDVIHISFDAIYGFDDILDYGDEIHNVIAFESKNGVLGSVEGYSGEPDSPLGNHVGTNTAFDNNEEKDIIEDLNSEHDNPAFIYAGVYTSLNVLSAARTSLSKDVMTNYDGLWSSGVYDGDPSNARTVYTGGIYQYRLRMMSDTDTISKDLILYDSLENFYAQEGNDEIDINAPRWQGKFRGVDVSQLIDSGCAPIVYYSTVPGLILSDESDPNAANHTNMDLESDIWVLASEYEGSLDDVKAVAIDASKTPEGEDFILNPMESVVVIINMKAPDTELATEYISRDAHAYNNAYLLCTSIDANTGIGDSDNFVRKDYTKVGLEEFKIVVNKVWDDDNNRDGIRPENVTIRLYANNQPTEKALELDGSAPGEFKHIPYCDENGIKINYSIREDVPEGYTSSISFNDFTYTVTNKHTPEKINLRGEKTWTGDSEENRPPYIHVALYANGHNEKQITVRSPWVYYFNDLYKYENGEEIIYTVEESGPKELDSYIPHYDGVNIENEYKPTGDLSLTKTVTGVTSVNEDKEFEFLITFVSDEPVIGLLPYTVYSGNVSLRTGELSSGDSIKLKDGERILITGIPEYVKYEILEKEEDGFSISSSAKLTGEIKPNQEVSASLTNKYSASGSINLSVGKTLWNRKMSKSQFIFEMYDEHGKLIKTATNGSSTLLDDGRSSEATATFGALSYTEKDHGKTFVYTVKERDRGKPGYTYDDAIYTVTVNPIDNGDGTMTINYVVTQEEEELCPTCEGEEMELPCENCNGTGHISVSHEAEMEFENTYKAEGETVIRAWKLLEGGKFSDYGPFEFELYYYDENIDEEIIYTATAENDGSVYFEALHFDETDIGNTYTYTLREKKGANPYVNYDPTKYEVTIAVFDNGDGTLSLASSMSELGVDRYYAINGWSYSNPFMYDYGFLYGCGDKRAGDLENALAVNCDRYLFLTETNLDTNEFVRRFDNATYNPDLVGFYSAQAQIDLLIESINEGLITNLRPGTTHSVKTPSGEIVPLHIEEYDLAEVSRTNSAYLYTNVEMKTVKENAISLFTNTLKPGSLSIEKQTENGGDPGQEFRFKVKFIGQDIENKEFEIIREKPPYNAYLTYDANGGIFEDGESKNQFTYIVNKGNATLLAGEYLEPTREMYVFDGWYEDRECTIEFTENPEEASITENKIVYAKWKKTEAYAVLDDDGNLIMFRSADDYINDTTGTFTDIKGSEYTGRIFAGLETTNYGTSSNSKWYNYRTDIKTVSIAEGQKIQPIKTSNWFYNCKSITSCDLTGFDTSNVTDMRYMFQNCQNLTTLDVSHFDTSNVTDVGCMFYNCQNLTTLDVSHFDTSNVTDVGGMFYNCQNLTTLDVSHFDTSNVTDVGGMFHNCKNLTTLDVSHFDTSNVTDMSCMFYNCQNLTTLDVSHFDTSNVTDVGSMFYNCQNLTTLDVSHFDTSNVTNMYDMFYNCQNLTTLDVSHFDTSNVTRMSGMFYRCQNLTATLNIMNIPSGRYAQMCYYAATQNGAQITLCYIDPVTSADIDELVATKNNDNSNVINGGKGAFTPPDTSNVWNENNSSPAKIVDNTSNDDSNENPENNSGENTENPGTSEDTEDLVFENGEAEFTLKANNKIIFSSIPAGTSYQVWEETPDGWVLIEQSNASGIIMPLEESEAKFTNRYQPGTTSVQFSGTKTLDLRAAEEGAFSFELWEGDTFLETVSTLDGGFIQFSVITYEQTDVGTHNYTIKEVNPNRDDIDYDTHIETITVEVSDDGHGNLTSEVTYDSDGINFSNMTRPGSLEIKKNATGTSTANQNDEFTLRITFENENGVPLSGDESIYYYKKDSRGNIIQTKGLLSTVKSWFTGEPDMDSVEIEPIEGSSGGGGKAELIKTPLKRDLRAISKRFEEEFDFNAYPMDDATVVASGNAKGYGDYPWVLYSDGTLVICESGRYGGTQVGGGQGTHPGGNWSCVPKNLRESVKHIRFEEGIFLGDIFGHFYTYPNLVSISFKGTRPRYPVGSTIFNKNPLYIEMPESGFTFRDWDSRKTYAVNSKTPINLIAGSVATPLPKLNNISGWREQTSGEIVQPGKLSIGGGAWEPIMPTLVIKNTGEGLIYNRVLSQIPLDADDIVIRIMGTSIPEVYRNLLVSVVAVDETPVTTCYDLFSGCKNLTTVDLTKLKPSTSCNMDYMFQLCFNLKAVDISTWNMSYMNGQQAMFSGCSLDVIYLPKGEIARGSLPYSKMYVAGPETTAIYAMKTERGDNAGWFNLDTEQVILSSPSDATGKGVTGTWVPYYEAYAVLNTETGVAHVYDGINGLNYTLKENEKMYVCTTNTTSLFGQDASLVKKLVFVDEVLDFTKMTRKNPNLEEIEFLSINTDTSDLSSAFYGDKSLKRIDLSDLSCVTNLYCAFYNCESLEEIIMPQQVVPAINASLTNAFTNCRSLRELDLTNWDLTNYNSNYSPTGWNAEYDGRALDRIIIGERSCGEKVTLSAWFGYDKKGYVNKGTWKHEGTYQPGTNYYSILAVNPGVYTRIDSGYRFYDEDAYILIPYVSIAKRNGTQPSFRYDIEVVFPSTAVVKPGYKLVSYSSLYNGNQYTIRPDVVYRSNAYGFILDSKVHSAYNEILLYPQWEYDGLNSVVVNHYKETVEGGEYVLAEAVQSRGLPGESITAEVKAYPGFHTDAISEIRIIPELDDEVLVLNYYYDRDRYTVSFNGNGAETGQMFDVIEAVGDVQYTLPKNIYGKKGAIFTGWNTEPDGSGVSYTDKASIKNIGAHGDKITLYAQWKENNTMLEPSSGVIEVTIKAGETLVIPDLPAGTKYIIEEINNPDGWTTSGYVNENGTITANTASQAQVNNRYNASGFAQIIAYKNLIGRDPAFGEFTFELLRNGAVIDTKSNEDIDDREEIGSENGTIPNPNYGLAPVCFDEITYTSAGTYTYQIREVNSGDENIGYDAHAETVTVTVTDAGSGRLETAVTYDSDGAVFTNSLAPGSLEIGKDIENATDVSKDTSFAFQIILKDSNGNELTGEYPAKIKHVDYSAQNIEVPVVRYSHTPNIDDSGNRNGGFGTNLREKDVITIPGAEALHVEVRYGTFGSSTSYGRLYVIQGNYTGSITTSQPANTVGCLYGYTTPYRTASYDVEGDTVTFGFYSGTSTYNNDRNARGYGYYAVVTSEGITEMVLHEEGYTDDTIASGETFHLKGGEFLNIEGLPDGATYEVIELPSDGWKLTHESGTTGVISSGELSEAFFTNTYSARGTFEIEGNKDLIGGDLVEESFAFRLEDEEGNEIGTAISDETGHFSFLIDYTLSDVGKTYTYYLSEVNEGRELQYDPHIKEIVVTVGDNGDGTLVYETEYEPETFTNYVLESIKVDKTVIGNMGDKSKPFTFELILEGEGMDNANITYVKDEIELPLGSYEFTLAHGEEIEFKNIPYGVTYTVKEKDYGEYEVTINDELGDSITGTLTDDVVVHFVNNTEVTVPTRVRYEAGIGGILVLLGIAVIVLRKLLLNRR